MRYHEFATPLREAGLAATIGRDVAQAAGKSVGPFNTREPAPTHAIGNTATDALANTAKSALTSQICEINCGITAHFGFDILGGISIEGQYPNIFLSAQ